MPNPRDEIPDCAERGSRPGDLYCGAALPADVVLFLDFHP